MCRITSLHVRRCNPSKYPKFHAESSFYLYQRIQLPNFYLTASIYQRRRLTTVYVRHWRTWPPEITKKDIVQDWDGLSTRISTKSDFKFLPYSLELPATSTDHGVCPSLENLAPWDYEEWNSAGSGWSKHTNFNEVRFQIPTLQPRTTNDVDWPRCMSTLESLAPKFAKMEMEQDWDDGLITRRASFLNMHWAFSLFCTSRDTTLYLLALASTQWKHFAPTMNPCS